MDAERRRIGAGGAALLLAVLWGSALYAIGNGMGLFAWIGVDYALFAAGAEVLGSDTPEAAYDLEVVARHLQPFRAYYRDPGLPARIGPSPHLPLTFWAYAPFARLGPRAGFLAWVAVNLALAAVVVRGLAARLPGGHPWASSALALAYFPLAYAVLVGQPIVVMLFAVDRAYRAWERGRDFEAGLWSGVLFLKVQYLPVLVLVLAYKRRWRSLAGIAAASLLIAAASYAVAGDRVAAAYLGSLRSASGFRTVHPLIHPHQMINWRGLLVNVLPASTPEGTAKGLTLLLSALTACTLPLVWRGPWDPAGPRFPVQVLATFLVTMLATFHNHLHGAALLLVPGMVLLSRGGGPSPLPWLLWLGLFAPIVSFTLHRDLGSVSLLFLGLMLTTLGAIVWASAAEGPEGVAAAAPGRRPLTRPA